MGGLKTFLCLREPQTQNEKNVFSIWTNTLAKSVEGLNTFLAQLSG